jgi:hypothetical protein
LPVLGLDAIGTRLGIVPEEALIAVLVVGFALGLIALVLGIYALTDIWQSGAEGAGPAIAGIVYASPALILLALVVAATVIYPRLTDVSTDPVDPPPLAANEPAGDPPLAERAALQRDAYPDLAPRIYPFPLSDVYAAARKLVAERGWILGRTKPPPAPPKVETVTVSDEDDAAEEELRKKGVMMQSRSEVIAPADIRPAEAAPTEENVLEEGTIQAVARTPVFGFPDDVALRLRLTPDGTLVDMRSASRGGRHDLGENARRIKRFLADLQLALQPEEGGPGLTSGIAVAPQSGRAGE